MEAVERTLLEEAVRDALARAAHQPAPKVDKALGELGWHEMLHAEPHDAVDVVFTALGSTNAAATALDDVVAAALGLEPRDDRAVLLPSFATWSPPARVEGDLVRAHGLTSARAATAKELVVVSRVSRGDGHDRAGNKGPGHNDVVLRTVTLPLEAVSLTPVVGIDPVAGFHVAHLEHAATLATETDATAWESAVAAGRRAIAHQIAGACRAMLDLACAHAVERVQFGRPIARFQAVRHRLAEALVAVESLDAALATAWDQPNAMTSALAKAIAGRTAQTVAAECQQVLAGIGFTTDHAFHRYLKRTMLLAGLFGSSDEIVTDIGRELIERRNVPTLIEL